MTNAGKASSSGTEAEIKARVTNNLVVSAGGGINAAVFALDLPKYSLKIGDEDVFPSSTTTRCCA